jgi:DNA-binding transcriptional ArsR family regulator
VPNEGCESAERKSRPARQRKRPNADLSQAKKGSTLLKHASDPVRLSILFVLADGQRGIAELVSLLRQSQPTVSHHLALLRLGGLVTPHRQGRHNLYSLTDRGRIFVSSVKALVSGGKPEARSIPRPSSIDPTLLEDVRGFVDDPEGWFRTPNLAFEGRRPIELLGTPDEARLRNRIEAAKLGMFS